MASIVQLLGVVARLDANAALLDRWRLTRLERNDFGIMLGGLNRGNAVTRSQQQRCAGRVARWKVPEVSRGGDTASRTACW